MYKITSNDEQETKKIAYSIAENLKSGDIIILSGDLGAGKTKFTEGLLSYWNLEQEISSPTFTIVNEYNKGSMNIYHFDLYRLEDIDEFYEIGGTEYFENGICVIEWGELIESVLPDNYIKVTFLKDEKNINLRHLILDTNNTRLDTMIKEIVK